MANMFITLFIADDLIEAITIRGKMRFCRSKLENNREQRNVKALVLSRTNFSCRKTSPTPVLKNLCFIYLPNETRGSHKENPPTNKCGPKKGTNS
jgi:hypothetical protein